MVKYAEFNGDAHLLSFGQENLFWANLVKKPQNFEFKMKFVIRLIPMCCIRWRCSDFFFWTTRYTPFGQISIKIANCPIKMKLGA